MGTATNKSYGVQSEFLPATQTRQNAKRAIAIELTLHFLLIFSTRSGNFLGGKKGNIWGK
jgi:hypothetical protein